MSTQYIETFPTTDEIPPVMPNAAAIGVVGGTPYMRSSAGLFALGLASFGKTYFVDTVNGNDANSGTAPDAAFQTMAAAFAVLATDDRIIFRGDVREQLVAPLGVYNVQIIGDPATKAHDDNAARWRAPAAPTAATALLRLREQGWTLANFIMKPPSDAAAVHLRRAEDATDPDPSHARFLAMRFDGGLTGIRNDGGAGFLLIDGCAFERQTGAGGGGYVVTSTAIAVPLEVVIQNCRFLSGQSYIIGPFSLGVIRNNIFNTATATLINTTDGSSQGGNTQVRDNSVNVVADEFDPSGATGTVTGLASDLWYNILKDTVESGQPA